MNRGKVKAVLIIVILLLIVAVGASWVISQKALETMEETPAPVLNFTDEQNQVSLSEDGTPTAQTDNSGTPGPTATPVPTPTPTPVPTPTPTPTPEPTPTPAPVGLSVGKGSFTSDTGLGINLRADWSAVTVSETQVELTVTISVDSYSLVLVAVPDSVKIDMNGQYDSLDAPAVNYTDGAVHNSQLCTKTYTVDLSDGNSKSLPLNVTWMFGGRYHDTDIPSIECGGTIILVRG